MVRMWKNAKRLQSWEKLGVTQTLNETENCTKHWMRKWQTGITKGYTTAQANLERLWGCRTENESNEHR